MFSFLLNSGGFGLNSNCCLNSSDSGHSAKIRGVLGRRAGKAKCYCLKYTDKISSPWEKNLLDLCSQQEEWFVFTAEAAFSAKSPALP